MVGEVEIGLQSVGILRKRKKGEKMGRLIKKIQGAMSPEARKKRAEDRTAKSIARINAETMRLKTQLNKQKPLIAAQTAKANAEAELLKAHTQLAKQRARVAKYKTDHTPPYNSVTSFLNNMNKNIGTKPGAGAGGSIFRDPFAPPPPLKKAPSRKKRRR